VNCFKSDKYSIRVCKSNASDRETVEMAKKWNKDLGEDQFIAMLKKMDFW